MARPSKEGKALNLKISTDVADRLEEYVNDTGITKTGAIERILRMYFDERDGKIKKFGDKNIL